MRNYRALSLPVIIFLFATYVLFHGGSETTTRSLKELWNLGHVAYFALLIYLISILPGIATISKKIVWPGLLVLSLVFGTVIEILQFGSDRTADALDIVNDVTGALLALVFIRVYTRRISRKVIFACRILVLLLMVIQMVPLAIAIMDETFARFQFPVLTSFNTPFELDRWEGISAEMEIHQSKSQNFLRIELTTKGQYSGISLRHFPPNWSNYESVRIRLLNPEPNPIEITVKIHDKAHENNYLYHDRYNRLFQLQQGWSQLEIAVRDLAKAPLERKMNLREISNLSLFTTALPESRVLYLDYIELFN